jgi:hypothetical protein
MAFSLPPCLAYLDPGTGSLILQALIAILLSTGVLLRRYILMPIQWLLGKLKRQPPKSNELFE